MERISKSIEVAAVFCLISLTGPPDSGPTQTKLSLLVSKEFT